MPVFYKKVLLGIVTVSAALVLAAQGANVRIELVHGGLVRTARLHQPPGYSAERPSALVIVMYGKRMWPWLMNYLTRFNRLSDREGFLVVYPEAIDKEWNVLPGQAEPAGAPEPDDVGFVAALVQRISETYAIDPDRIYVTGMSNGAMMAHRLAYELSGIIAAAAPVGGTMPADILADPAPVPPVPVVMIHGTMDPGFPWEPGDGSARYPSLTESLQFWVHNNTCCREPEVAWQPDRDPFDKSRVRRETYRGAASRQDVVLYAVEGGGHTWPGGPLIQKQWEFGPINRDIDATEVIWAFFQDHPKPAAF